MMGNCLHTYGMFRAMTRLSAPYLETHLDSNESGALQILMPPEKAIKLAKEETRSRVPIAFDRLGGETNEGWPGILH